jgi:hypothetical protein
MPRRLTYGSAILGLRTRWRCVVSFALRPLYPGKNSSRYPLDMRLTKPQNRSECCGEEKNLAFAGNQTAAVEPVARLYTD